MIHPIERIQLSPLRRLGGSLHRLVDRRLWAKVLVGMGLGAAVGVALGPSVGWVPPGVASPLVSWLALPGMLFLALIQMIVIPLVFASVVRGLAASENVAQLRAVGIGAAAYFLVTTALATGLGLLLGLAIRPGRFIDAAAVKEVLAAPAPAPSSPRSASWRCWPSPPRALRP